MAAAQESSSNDAFLITRTASGTKIEILTHPDFPLGSFLLEIFLWNFALFVLVLLVGSDWFCWTLYFFGATFGSLGLLVWNYWSKVTLELTLNSLRIQRFLVSSRPEIQSYHKNEVANLYVIQPDERRALFEGVLGLRLFSLRSQGMIGFETPQGMIVRFGWGLSYSEAEEVVSIIKNWLQEPTN
ncbi:MAG: hypothetical protein CL608_28000 [Anaerolineaceae bacterium]|nr:hypothetical protein [Anaerolineaceae bacterium]